MPPALARVQRALTRTIWPADKLVGTEPQRRGGVWVISSRDEARMLLDVLMQHTDPETPAGLDTEFTGCELKREHPIGKARIVMWSTAFVAPELGTHPDAGTPIYQRVVVPNFGQSEYEGWMYELRAWFESADHPKAGSHFFNIDSHAFNNHGITVYGVIDDNVRQSQMHQTGKVYEHGLKPRSQAAFGYEMRDYEQVLGTLRLKADGNPYAPRGKNKDKPVLDITPLDKAVLDQRLLEDLWDYASLDAKASGEGAIFHNRQMAKLPWMPDKVTGNMQTMRDFYDQTWNPYQWIIYGIECAGWDADRGWFETQRDQSLRDRAELEERLNQWAGSKIKWSSWQQKQHFLFEKGEKVIAGVNVPGKGFPSSPVTKSGPADDDQLSTDSVAIRWVRDHVQKKEDKAGLLNLLHHTKVDTLYKNFLNVIPDRIRESGKIHSRIGAEADTGRLTSKQPPLNTCPRPGWDPSEPWDGDPYDIREGFICGDGEALVGADYSQLEMRILAHYLIILCKDTSLADDLAAGDLHAATALRVWGNDPLLHGLTPKDVKSSKDPRIKVFRNRGKIVNFSVNYGKTAVGLGSDIRDHDGEPIGKVAAQKILDDYFKAYPAILRYHQWAKNYVRKNGYVRTLLGRYRYLPKIFMPGRGAQGEAERAALNTPIQGSAADVVAMAMLRTNTLPIPDLIRLGHFDEELYDLKATLVMQIHDELIWRCPNRNREAVKKRGQFLMERPFDGETPGFPGSGLLLPTDAAVGYSYLEIK